MCTGHRDFLFLPGRLLTQKYFGHRGIHTKVVSIVRLNMNCSVFPKVKDQEFPYRKNLARVLVEVEDINDHVPIFTSALYEGLVYESAAVGSAVVQVTALDKDKGENAELHYTIEAGWRTCSIKLECSCWLLKKWHVDNV